MMKLKPTYLFSVVILLTCSFMVGCTFSETKSKDPVFNTDAAIMQKDLNNMVTCENINVDGKEITTNGKVNSQLEISITNGQNIPANEDQMKSLGKSIASYIKKSLKDKNEYENYTVLFVTKKTAGGVTTRNWKGDTYKTEEL
jgi:hypothetical protein